MSSNCQLDNRSQVGSAEWVRRRVAELSDDGWTARPECLELVQWLYAVARHRVRRLGAPTSVRGDLVQDVMSSIFHTLESKRHELSQHGNPAAALEVLVVHSASEAYHNYLMAGFGGVAKNGRNWGKAFPRRISFTNLDESLAAPPLAIRVSDETADAAQRLSLWITKNLALRLTAEAVDATTYILDRLRAGVSRSSLVRGSYSCLTNDPAMHFLGFDRESSAAYSRWLLVRPDRNVLGVIDAASFNAAADNLMRTRWRQVALGFGFANPSDLPPPPACNAVDLTLDRGRMIA